MRRGDWWLLGAAASSMSAAAIASETINYTYDSRGRLTKVVRSGSLNGGVSTSYAYDKADNRTSRTTTGVGMAAATTSLGPDTPIGEASTAQPAGAQDLESAASDAPGDAQAPEATVAPAPEALE